LSKLPKDCPYYKLYDDCLKCPEYQKCVVNPNVHEQLVRRALKIIREGKQHE